MNFRLTRLVSSAALLAGLLRAQSTTIVVPAATANKNTAIAVAQYNINTKQDYAALATMAYVNSVCKVGKTIVCPDFVDDDAATQFIQDKYDVFKGNQPSPSLIAGLSKEEIIKFTLEQGVKALAVKNPAIEPWGDFAVAGLDLYQKSFARQLDQENRDKAQFQSYDNFTSGTDSAYATATVSAFIDVVKTNPELKAATNFLFAQSVFGGHLDDSARAVRIQNNPQFATYLGIEQLLAHFGSNGDFTALLSDTNSIVTTNFQAVLSDLGDVRKTLSTIVQDQSSILAYVKDINKQQQDQALAERELQIKQLRMEAASSTVYLLSSFIGVVDPHLGKEVSIAGNAAINLVSSIARFNDSASHFNVGSSSGLNEATALGSLVMAGNVFGSAMQIVSLFSDDGPSPDQIIIQQLQQISQQIIDLHRDMDARFDQVDQSLKNINVSLSQIYNSLTDQLTSIATGVGRLNDKVEVIESQLSGLQSDISRMEHEIHSNELDIYRAPLLLAIDSAISFKERTGADLPYIGNSPTDYTSLESTFFTWATQLSAQGIDAPLPTGNDAKFNDDQLADTLSLGSLAVNINYLNLLPAVKFNLPPLLSSNGAPVPLANLEDWARSAQAYVELAREWPVHDRRFPSAVTRLAQVRAVGKNLQTAVKAVTVKADGTSNAALFSALRGFYTAKSANFISALDSYGRQFEVTLGATGFDLWAGGAQQTIPAHVPKLLPTGAVNYGGSFVLSPPVGYTQFLANSELNADRLGLQALDLTYDVWWSEKPVAPNSSVYHSWITIYGYFFDPDGSQTLLFFRTIKGPDVSNRGGGFIGQPGGTIEPSYPTIKTAWEGGLKNAFAAQSVNGFGDELIAAAPPGLNLKALQEVELSLVPQWASYWEYAVNQALVHRQSAFYAQLLNDLNSKQPLLTPVRELSGAAAMFAAVATFGLQRTLESDELLRTLLLGQERIADASMLTELLSKSASSLTDPKAVSDTLNTRLTSAFNEINTVIGQISTGSRREGSRAVDNMLGNIDRHSTVRLLPLAIDATSSVQITKSGFRYNTGTKSFVQTILIKNVGTMAISGPVTLVLDLLTSGTGQNDTTLTNANGQTVIMAPLGSAYTTVNIGLASSLAAGASVSTTLNFSSPSQTGILYQTRVLAGSGFR